VSDSDKDSERTAPKELGEIGLVRRKNHESDTSIATSANAEVRRFSARRTYRCVWSVSD
jgi:hypothetical protein